MTRRFVIAAATAALLASSGAAQAGWTAHKLSDGGAYWAEVQSGGDVSFGITFLPGSCNKPEAALVWYGDAFLVRTIKYSCR
jgi:type 1 fimbria pilin